MSSTEAKSSISIFKHTDYREYLIERIGSRGSRSGLKSQLAKTADMHLSQLSSVLSGRIELSLEQADKVNQFLNHDENESYAFLLLLLKSRTESQALKNRFHQEFQKLESATQSMEKLV